MLRYVISVKMRLSNLIHKNGDDINDEQFYEPEDTDPQNNDNYIKYKKVRDNSNLNRKYGGAAHNIR